MKNIYYFIILWFLLFFGQNVWAGHDLSGRIFLQVEKNGEAWYFEPTTSELLYLGRPSDAFQIMRSTALGVSNTDFGRLKNDPPRRLWGRILLKVEDDGEAWYVDPVDQKLHFLSRPADAFRIMRELGLGVSEKDFAMIRAGELSVATEKSVPFTSQAPYGGWSNPRFQDGCEEASVLMAMAWAKSFSFNTAEAKEMILDLSRFAEKIYGEFRDQSVVDTARLIEEFYDYKKYEVREGDINDVITVVSDIKVVILPFNGQKLGNPYFTPPGPINHMAVIHGYDSATDEFIVNDPGTRHGKNFRYKSSIIDNAWREYPTGYHLPIERIEKRMIVVGR